MPRLDICFGDCLYSRYSLVGNVGKTHASCISCDRTILPAHLKKKILAISLRPGFKPLFAACLFSKKGPDIAIKVEAILYKKGIPHALGIYGSWSDAR
jgi:hypothetical protein